MGQILLIYRLMLVLREVLSALTPIDQVQEIHLEGPQEDLQKIPESLQGDLVDPQELLVIIQNQEKLFHAALHLHPLHENLILVALLIA